MEQHITSTDKKFYGVLAVAVLALLVGAIGLIVSLSRPNVASTNSTGTTGVPSGFMPSSGQPAGGSAAPEVQAAPVMPQR